MPRPGSKASSTRTVYWLVHPGYCEVLMTFALEKFCLERLGRRAEKSSVALKAISVGHHKFHIHKAGTIENSLFHLKDLVDAKQVFSQIPNTLIATYRSGPSWYLRRLMTYHRLSLATTFLVAFGKKYKIGTESRLLQTIITNDN